MNFSSWGRRETKADKAAGRRSLPASISQPSLFSMAVHAMAGTCWADHLWWFTTALLSFSLHEMILGHLWSASNLEGYMVKLQFLEKKKVNHTHTIKSIQKSSFLPVTRHFKSVLKYCTVPPLFRAAAQSVLNYDTPVAWHSLLYQFPNIFDSEPNTNQLH